MRKSEEQTQEIKRLKEQVLELQKECNKLIDMDYTMISNEELTALRKRREDLNGALRFRIEEEEKLKSEHSLALADAQFIGYSHGKHRSLIEMVESMGLSKAEFEGWKKQYGAYYLTDLEMEELEEHFAVNPSEVE